MEQARKEKVPARVEEWGLVARGKEKKAAGKDRAAARGKVKAKAKVVAKGKAADKISESFFEKGP